MSIKKQNILSLTINKVVPCCMFLCMNIVYACTIDIEAWQLKRYEADETLKWYKEQIGFKYSIKFTEACSLISSEEKNLFNENGCNICLEENLDKGIIKIAKCNHIFHHHCIAQWIEQKTMNNEVGTCPTCRGNINCFSQTGPSLKVKQKYWMMDEFLKHVLEDKDNKLEGEMIKTIVSLITSYAGKNNTSASRFSLYNELINLVDSGYMQILIENRCLEVPYNYEFNFDGKYLRALSEMKELRLKKLSESLKVKIWEAPIRLLRCLDKLPEPIFFKIIEDEIDASKYNALINNVKALRYLRDNIWNGKHAYLKNILYIDISNYSKSLRLLRVFLEDDEDLLNLFLRSSLRLSEHERKFGNLIVKCMGLFTNEEKERCNTRNHTATYNNLRKKELIENISKLLSED